MEKKRIALLLAQADEPYQQGIIRGVKSRAKEAGYSVCIYSMHVKYQNNKEREKGEANIYRLIDYDAFDAVIILSDTIQTPGVEKRLEEDIHEHFKGAVIAVDTDSRYFQSFWTDGYPAVYATVSHFIEEHNYKDIAYLTGRENHAHSRRRLQAYKDAMAAHDLPVRDDRIFFGDFWYTSGTSCAEKLLRDRENMPEAVICANDCMAIGFAEEMTRRGIRIPDNIALAGYGTTEEGQTSPEALTSTEIPAEYYGRYAVECILARIAGEEMPELSFEAKLFLGESCGCHGRAEAESVRRSTWATRESNEGIDSIHNYMEENMLLASTLEEFFRTVFESVYYIPYIRKLDICLDSGCLSPRFLLNDSFLSEGYPKKMLRVLTYDEKNSETSSVSIEDVRDAGDLQAEEIQDADPDCYFLPLFFEDKTFGYACLGFEEDGCFTGAARRWLMAVSRGLESLRRKYIYSLLMKRDKAKYPLHTEPAAGLDRNKSSYEDVQAMAEVEKILDGNLLTYHFQPIVRAGDGEIYSYEALMRSASAWKLSPLDIIRYADMLGRISDVEKATFTNVLNIVTEKRALFEGKKVFINSIPGVRMEYSDFVRIEELLRRHSDIAVVELTEQAELSDEELENVKQQYRRMGIGLAVDDYGTGYSNVSNLLRYMPDYVKIDRSLLSDIQDNVQKQHFVREVIDFCHANHIQALAEGVETSEELKTVIRLGADLIQGYYTGMPSEEICTSIAGNVKMEIIRFHQEKEDGSSENVYVAGQTSRISLNSLIKENKTTIQIGAPDATFRDMTITGTPNADTQIHIELMEGYDGRVTLENVCLSNIKKRPCIHLADNVRLTLRLEGENRLKGGGIKVPESSVLIVEGDGNLKIAVSGSENYAIGNTVDKGHGRLEFYQDGEIRIDSTGQKTIGIGSGLGGITHINKGKYEIYMNGDEGVGIGSFRGSQPLHIHDCDMYMNNTFYKGVFIGNIEENTEVKVWRSLLRCEGSGKRFSVLGTVEGGMAKVNLHDLFTVINVRGDYSTGVGSLEGSTRFDMSVAALHITSIGREARCYGGYSPDTRVRLENMDVVIDLTSDSGKLMTAPQENIEERFVRPKITINGEQRIQKKGGYAK